MLAPANCRPRPYHERQHLFRCLGHALNALLQRPAFDAVSLNGVADRLTAPTFGWIPRHRVPWLGDYDANVLDAALQQEGLELTWHDRRDMELSRLHTDDARLVNIIANVTSAKWVGARLGRRHWLAVICLDGTWWDLDSELQAPHALGAEADARAFLAGLLAGRDAQLLLVLRPA